MNAILVALDKIHKDKGVIRIIKYGKMKASTMATIIMICGVIKAVIMLIEQWMIPVLYFEVAAIRPVITSLSHFLKGCEVAVILNSLMIFFLFWVVAEIVYHSIIVAKIIINKHASNE